MDPAPRELPAYLEPEPRLAPLMTAICFIWDALTFITTCLWVGYDDVIARTNSGKAIASFVMTFGPAAWATGPPDRRRSRSRPPP